MKKRVKSKAFIAIILLFLLCFLIGCRDRFFYRKTAPNPNETESMIIKIGLVAPVSGINQSTGTYMLQGFRLAQKEINEQGGILGKQIELTVVDEGSSVEESVNATNMLLADKSIAAIIGSFYSQYSLEILPEIEKKQIPYVSCGSSSLISKQKNPYTWQLRPIDTYQGIIMADFLVHTLGIHNPAILYSDSSTFVSLSKQLQSALESFGITLSDKNFFCVPEDEYNFEPYLKDIMSGKFDSLVALTHQVPAGVICQQAKTVGIDPKTFPCIGSTSYSSFICRNSAGDSSNNWYSISDWLSESTDKANIDFVEAYQKAYQTLPDLPAAVCYDSLYLLKESCELAESTDPKKINEAMNQIKNYPGALSTYSSYENHVFATTLNIARNQKSNIELIETIQFREP